MLNIQDLQNSIHKTSIKGIESLQIIKMRIQAELKEEMEPQTRKALEKDVIRCRNIIDQILCFEVMEEFYQTGKQSEIFRNSITLKE